MLLSAARNIFDKNIVDKRDPGWAPLSTSVLADTIDSRLENLLERPAMLAYARSHIVPPDEVGVSHCMARCVRRAFLCGVDPFTNHDYDYRNEWIRERLELLASVFAINICAADPARQAFVTSRLDRSTASGSESSADPGSARANSGATGNRRRRLDRDPAAIRSPVQDSRRPTRRAGGPRRTQGQGLAPGQQRRCPGLSIAGRSVTERARPMNRQHAWHRKATPRSPALVSAQNASWASL
jgi:hypothetical protein